MNDIQISENKEELTLTTIDIADMMEMPHWQILRKLDGTKKIKGIIQILGDNKIVVTDYFIPSTYLSEQNKEMPCYKITRMGCEFLANKFNGEKGIVFTARYVKRFHDMEQAHICAHFISLHAYLRAVLHGIRIKASRGNCPRNIAPPALA